MSNAREKILSHIRHSLGRGTLSVAQQEILQSRLQQHPRGILPKLKENAVEIFIERARIASTNVEIIQTLTEIPTKVVELLKSSEKRTRYSLRLSAEPLLQKLSWEHYPELITSHSGPVLATDYASMTLAFCGVAETGTLVLRSSAASPTTLNFLPEINIVLLETKNIVAHYEDAWDLIRKQKLPRTVNFITGPSRTGDIEQTIQMGIHGPKQLHILLLHEV